jgi:ADP-heptose:LPS heptosyltransferase
VRMGSQAAAKDGCNRSTDAPAAFASLRPTTHEPYEVVATADLPDAIRAQLPVQDFVHKLLAAISHSEQLLDEQNEALTKFRREASDRANLASYVLSKLLVQYWCALVPAETWRYRVWSHCVRPIVRRMVIRKSPALASPPAAALPPASEAATASTPAPANLAISAEPALASVPSRAVTFPGLPRLVSSKEAPLRILILKLDHIGDLLLSVAALFLLREAWPKAHFTLVCGPWNVKLASQFGIFDEIHSYNFFSPHSGEGINAGITEFRRLPLREYDLAIDLRHDPETRPLLNFVRARYRAGFVCDPQFPVRLDLAIPNLELISPLEAPRNALHSETRLITLASAIVATFGEHKGCNLQNLLASRTPLRYFDEGPVVALAPGTGNAIKQWGAARFARVARALATEARCRFVLIGGESDKTDAAVVAAALASDQYVDVVGKLEISDVPLALAAVDLFIGNDTGTTHMAALMGVPTVNIFAGLADVNIWCAKGPNVVTLYAPVDCAPCRLGKLQDCSHGHICLTSISEDDVVTSALSLLQRSQLQDVRHEIRKVAPREKVTADAGTVRRLDVGWLVADQQ